MTTHTCVVCAKEYLWIPQAGRRRSNACSPECRRLRHVQMNEKSRQRAVARGCPPDKHGTVTGYTQYKCTCAHCRGWASEYQRQRRQRQRLGRD